MVRRVNDPRQDELRLFGPPPAPPTLAGSFNYSHELRQALAQVLKDSPASRAEVAVQMTEMVFGHDGEGEITVAQLNSWTACSKGEWRFPLEYLPAFIQATGGVWLVDWLAQRCGCRALRGEQAVLVEMSAKKVLRQKAEAEMKRLDKELKGLEASVTPELLDGLQGREVGK
jgi:hypothetical protein